MAIMNGRSNISGHLPTAIPNEGQLFIQQADDILLTRKPDGSFRQTLLPKRAGVSDVSYTVNRWDTYIGLTVLTAPRTIQLPPAAAYPLGHPLEIADESGNCSTTNQITVLPAGSDTINGAVSLPITAPLFGARLYSDGVSKWVSPQYTANNSAALSAAVTAAQNAQTAAETAVALVGQCSLSYVSATQLLLKRASGRLIFVNGAARQVPAAGVSVDNTGLMGSTVYFVYAYMNGANLALEASTTAPAVDQTYGHVVKGGATTDSTRTLVGATYTAGASNAAGTYQGGLCTLSFHNRRDIETSTGVISPSTSASSFTILAGSLMQGLCWADETIDAEFTGQGVTGNNNAGVYANMRTVIGDPAAAAPSTFGPSSKAGGQAFVAGGVASRVFTRPGTVSAIGAWAQGFGDSGVGCSFILSGILKTRG